ncbi:MAG: ATP-grasp domain-containing protein [Lachnospiraceae bacterium]|nr:ATP-grasp domain-containing protein [Lachnospiraceae bacterium]
MKKILITGGSHSEIPLIDAIRRLGDHYIISTGRDEGGLGHQKTDKYVRGDYSDGDFVLKLAREEGVAAIVSGCNDFAYLSTAYACEALGLPGHDSYETARKFHRKNVLRSICEKLGVRVPFFREIAAESELEKYEWNYPIIIKPTDLTGGKGVRKCSNLYEAQQAYHMAVMMTRQNVVLAEEYIEGTNNGASMLLKEGKVVFSFFDNEEYYLNKYLVSGAYAPSDLSEETRAEIVSGAEKIAKELSLTDGLFHCQYIVDKDGKPYLIDPCRRTPGDLYVMLVEYSTGCRYAENIVRAELAMDYELPEKPDNRIVARECLMTDRNGIFRGIEIPNEYRKRMIDSIIWARSGFLVDDYLKFKFGIVFYEFENREIQKYLLKYQYSNISIKMEDVEGRTEEIPD